MFDAIGVSGRTQKPWTVVISFIGQMAMIGLAILFSLIGTDALPHRLAWITLPEPPPALPHRPPQAQLKHAGTVPRQMARMLVAWPARIPDRAVILQDSEPILAAGDGVGVPGGFGNSNGPGNGAIDNLVRSMPLAAPPPMHIATPPAPPAPPKRIRLGGIVVEGKLISGPRPIYPPLARQARIEGTVRLEAVISRDGAILNLRVLSGHPMLIPAAVAAVRQWVFRPTSLNGEAVEVATEIEVNFTLQR